MKTKNECKCIAGIQLLIKGHEDHVAQSLIEELRADPQFRAIIDSRA